MRTLLALDLFEMTVTEIAKHLKPGMVDLPQYCITDKGKIQRAEYYHQFAYEGDEKYILFNALPCDDILSEEISNTGIEDLLNFDLTPFIEEFRKRGMIKEYENFRRSLGTSSYLVVNLNYYSCGSYGEPNDWDMDVYLDGILDYNLNLVEIEMVEYKNKKNEKQNI